MAKENVHNICFHGIGTPHRELEPGEAPYWVSHDLFLRVLDEARTWPSARISFDDSNISDLEFGLPALVERGLTAQFFVLSGRIGRSGSLGADDVQTLHQHGMLIGTHGMHHRSWRGMDRATSHVELVEARAKLQELTEADVGQAALPLGRYDRRLLRELHRLGYSRIHTSDRRVARSSAWIQPRFSIRSSDTVHELRSTVLTQPHLAHRAKQEAVAVVKRLR